MGLNAIYCHKCYTVIKTMELLISDTLFIFIDSIPNVFFILVWTEGLQSLINVYERMQIKMHPTLGRFSK